MSSLMVQGEVFLSLNLFYEGFAYFVFPCFSP